MECDITGIQCLNRESVLSSSYIYSLYRENPLSQTSWSFENQQLISSFLSASMSSSSSNSKQITGSPSSPFKRLRMASSSVARQEDGYVPFADLSTGLDRAIKVMVCRWWDACSTAGKYLSTEFIMPECAGNAIHCVARSSISNCFATKFEVGEVYSMKHFTVQPNKDTYRLRNSVNTSLNWKAHSEQAHKDSRRCRSSSPGTDVPHFRDALEAVDCKDAEYKAIVGTNVDKGKTSVIGVVAVYSEEHTENPEEQNEDTKSAASTPLASPKSPVDNEITSLNED